MASEETKKKEHDPIFMVCLVLFVIAAAAVLCVYAADHLSSHDDRVAAYGDSVTVNYTGSYYNYVKEDGALVFDTSYESVAKDNSIAKSSDFTVRPSYSPLSVTIGSGSALEPFENSIVGHKVGDVFKVWIPADEGYVGPNTTDIANLNGYTVPTTQYMPNSAFSSLYGESLTAGVPTSIKTVYGWDAIATLSSSNSTVTIMNNPVAGSTYTFSPKGVEPAAGEEKLTFAVTSVDSSNITCNLSFKNTTVVSGNTIQMEAFDFGTAKWYVKEVSPSTFTYKVSTTGTVNEDLYFEIKLVSIS
ncbi:MAG: FKBP-type peptidyl-prolyl cis-trans isomerase [Candidatus Methanomethylophilaceae archaeon]|nr:FKBP-type peptidyl-prolyl cis-trans isomerase [Candidatus Methanomethylophilaceae archaeon]